MYQKQSIMKQIAAVAGFTIYLCACGSLAPSSDDAGADASSDVGPATDVFADGHTGSDADASSGMDASDAASEGGPASHSK